MRMIFPRTLIAACAVALLGAPVSAQDKPTEVVLSEAQGFLHLTCNTLIESYGDDEDTVLDIIELMIAVSLNNRGIDFTNLNLTDQETVEIQAEFADEIGDGCADDADALMAGIIDNTVAALVEFY